jgi:hypothetical protein
MADKGWLRRFDDPIETPDGTQLKTVPKSKRDMPAVTTAAEMLTNAAERGIAWMFMARMAVMKALHRPDVQVFNPDAKEHHWGKRKLKRDE